MAGTARARPPIGSSSRCWAACKWPSTIAEMLMQRLASFAFCCRFDRWRCDMQAGDLDRRITIRRATVTTNPGTGLPEETWGDLATVWAHRHDVSDSEKYAAGSIHSALLSRFTVRSSAT